MDSVTGDDGMKDGDGSMSCCWIACIYRLALVVGKRACLQYIYYFSEAFVGRVYRAFV